MQLASSELSFEAEIPSRTWIFFVSFFLSIKKCVHEAQITVTTLVDKKEWDVSYLEQPSGKRNAQRVEKFDGGKEIC